MKILITGGAGFIGKKLVSHLLEKGSLDPAGKGEKTIIQITVLDIVEATGLPDDPRLVITTGDIRKEDAFEHLIDEETGVIFHLAAIVSADAEANFDLGMNVNLDGTRYLLETCRKLASTPVVVFSSSVAVYGGKLPRVGNDQTLITPSISYGIQKYMGELLVSDFSRKGYIDGRSLRLPTIMVRPGKPNKAASTFASSIIRDPLAGKPANCPVDDSVRMYILSPRKVVAALIHAAELTGSTLGEERAFTLPGISVSIRTMVDALEKIAGKNVANRIDWTPDPVIRKIVDVWMTDFDAQRGRELGFEADHSFEEIIMGHIEDELGGMDKIVG